MFDYYVEVLITLAANLLIMNVAYLAFSVLKWVENMAACVFFGVMLHYFLLGSFLWMLCLAFLQYLIFNKGFNSQKYLHFYSWICFLSKEFASIFLQY
jgi:hypothetical protein